ncbi:hypothetical protein ACFXJ8_29285 [Nonomuraea sp. NPDC059194]|uniref:hypothetical protein n=1 Tax=Nonomuraea sp. NPDC059194 TaxID=3346764 RepID=UPI0036B48344
MNTPTKLGAYVLGLAVVFGAALGVGSAVGEVGTPPKATTHTESAAHGETTATTGHTETADRGTTSTGTTATEPGGQEEAAGHEDGGHSTSATATATAAKSEDTPGGLQVSENGYTFTPATNTLKAGEPTDFSFTVTGPDGKPVTAFDVQHEKKVHFIVVSRDLNTFQHLHPEEGADGVWTVKLTLPEAGVYRAYADILPTGASAMTLGTDLFAAGEFAPKPLPAVSRTAEVDGYTVTLAGDLVPGKSSKLTLSVAKDGKPVTDVQPYLGALGHLVALRAGDLAYLHVHPEENSLTFHAEVPSRGDYRLFLDFKHQDKVRTAAFTVKATDATATPSATPSTAPSTAPSTTPSTHPAEPHGH